VFDFIFQYWLQILFNNGFKATDRMGKGSSNLHGIPCPVRDFLPERQCRGDSRAQLREVHTALTFTDVSPLPV